MMDSAVEIMHVVECGKPKQKNEVVVCLSPLYNRKKVNSTHINSTCEGVAGSQPQECSGGTFTFLGLDIESIIDTIWSERLKENARLFNGTKFRLHSISSSIIDLEDTVEMQIGLTDYKEFLGTNWAPNVKALRDSGLHLWGNSQAFLSDALGVGAFVITSDDYVVLIKRSAHCAEAPDLWDVPGGHAEPKEIVGDLSLDEMDVESFDDKSVVHEIFDSIVREVTDEINIPVEKLSVPLYFGTARNTTSGGRPSLAFEIRCSLTHDEVFSLYRQGSQMEADESTNITFVQLDDIASIQTQPGGLWEKMAPSAKGNFTLYSIVFSLKQ